MQLHDDEQTATAAAAAVSDSLGIPFLRILNNGRRKISFHLNGTVHSFDPNRMFTDSGLRATVKPYDPGSCAAVKRFAHALLQLVDTGKFVIAVHNNDPDGFSVLYWQEAGRGQTRLSPDNDPDDFFVTTDPVVFQQLHQFNTNAALEAATVEDDGSLSVYFGRRKRGYANVEAEHGKLTVQRQMIGQLLTALKAGRK